MSHQNSNRVSDDLANDPAADLQSIFERTAPEITSVDVDALRAEAESRSLRQLPQSSRPSMHWSKIMSVRNLIAVAVVAFVILLCVVPADRSAVFAWDDMKNKVEKSRTIQFVVTEYPPNDRTSARTVRRTMIRGRYLKRDEIDDEATGKTRIGIYDAKKGIRVMIRPDARRFIIFKTLVTVEVERGKTVDLNKAATQESKIKPQPKLDFHRSFMKMILPRKKDAAKRLSGKTIDGKKVIGFRTVEKLFRGQLTMTRTFWIDPKTKLPVRVEGSNRSKSGKSDSDWVMSDFQFDEKLDDSLFKLEPPKGYSVEERKLYHAKPN